MWFKQIQAIIAVANINFALSLLSYRIKQFRIVLEHFKRWTSGNDILFFRSIYKVPVVVNMVGFWLHVCGFVCCACKGEDFMNENVLDVFFF